MFVFNTPDKCESSALDTQNVLSALSTAGGVQWKNDKTTLRTGNHTLAYHGLFKFLAFIINSEYVDCSAKSEHF